MDRWDNEPRVRPISIDDDGTQAWEQDPTRPTVEHWTRRPWLPIGLTTVAMVGVLTSVTLFGAIEQEETLPALDALPFADVRPLQEVIPGITDRLTLIVVGPDGPATLLWDPSFVEPRVVDIQHEVEDGLEYEASFDSSGRFVTLASAPPQTEQISLRVGIPTDLGTVDLDEIDSYQWHATEVGRIAYVRNSETGAATLYTAVIDPFSRLLLEVAEVAEVDGFENLERWDSSGFIVSGTRAEMVRALDSSGVELWSTPGQALATSGHTVFIAASGADDAVVSTVVAFDRGGTMLGTALDGEPGAETSIRTMALSTNSDLTATVDVTGNVTTLEVNGPQLSGPRIVVHQGGLLPLGFTSNDAFFVFAAHTTNDLTFIEWDIGAMYTIDVPDDFDVVGLDIG